MSEWVHSRRLYHFRCGLHFVVADEDNAHTLAQWKCAGGVLDSTLTLRKCSSEVLDSTLTLWEFAGEGLDSTLTLQKCSSERLDSTLTPWKCSSEGLDSTLKWKGIFERRVCQSVKIKKHEEMSNFCVQILVLCKKNPIFTALIVIDPRK